MEGSKGPIALQIPGFVPEYQVRKRERERESEAVFFKTAPRAVPMVRRFGRSRGPPALAATLAVACVNAACPLLGLQMGVVLKPMSSVLALVFRSNFAQPPNVRNQQRANTEELSLSRGTDCYTQCGVTLLLARRRVACCTYCAPLSPVGSFGRAFGRATSGPLPQKGPSSSTRLGLA